MRPLLFATLVISLLAVLPLVGLHRAEPRPPNPPTRTAAARPQPTHSPPPPGARRPVRHFIAAFLSYEVDRGGRRSEATIRASASPRFDRQLLSRPPTPPGRPSHATTRITSLRVDHVPGHPDLVIASGDARRPEGLEPFSVLFARLGGRWRAVAPGE